MYTFLVVLFVLLSFLMIVVILLQAGKGQGLAGAIGGGMAGQSIFGGRGAGDFLSKATTYIATGYMILAIAIGLIYKTEAEETQKSLIQKRMETQQSNEAASPLPLAPVEGLSTDNEQAPVQEQQQQPQPQEPQEDNQ
jgi:preprotein translocase subunit SecG